MDWHTVACRAAALLLIVVHSGFAWAGDRVVQLRTSPPLARELAALPTITDPVDDAERRINAALRRLDSTGQRAASECRTASGKPGSWRRTVDSTMHGPRYLSLVIRDDSFCDGAHPNSDLQAIVYDLRTGRPIDWSTLLPASLTGSLSLRVGDDGTRMVVLASPRLHALYLAGYRAAAIPEEERADCRDAVALLDGDGPPAMMAWLDARAGGLALYRPLPNVVKACAEAVVISTADLEQEGVDAELIHQIQASALVQ